LGQRRADVNIHPFPPLFDVDANLATNVILHMMLFLDDG